MGLRNKELKKLELRLEFLEFLKEYGIDANDLHYLHEAVECYKELKKKEEQPKEYQAPLIDEKTKAKIKEKYEGKMTPDEFISQFAGESEDFYPYGKPKDNN